MARSRHAPQRAERFVSTALWFPRIPMDAEGLAVVRVKLPAYVGELRWVAVAARDDALGWTYRSMTVKRPLLMEVSAPRFAATAGSLRVARSLGRTGARSSRTNESGAAAAVTEGDAVAPTEGDAVAPTQHPAMVFLARLSGGFRPVNDRGKCATHDRGCPGKGVAARRGRRRAAPTGPAQSPTPKSSTRTGRPLQSSQWKTIVPPKRPFTGGRKRTRKSRMR